MVRLSNEHVQSFGHADVTLGEHATNCWLVRIATLPNMLVVLIFSSNHVITMDLHASQIQGLSMSLAFSGSKLLMVAGFFNVPVRQDIVSTSFTLTVKYRSIICMPR